MKNWTFRFRAIDKRDFDDIKNCLKIVETRAATKKYAHIRAGDTLTFACGKERLEKEVKKVKHFPTIEAMIKTIPIKNIMPRVSSLEEAKKRYYSFTGYREKIKKFGLVAFFL